jgi:hypothetical protein
MQSNPMNISLGRFVTYQAKKQKFSESHRLSDKKVVGELTKQLILPIRKRAGSMGKQPARIKKVDVSETSRLESMADNSHQVLLSASTVFPFVIFPDTVQIDRQKLTIIHRGSFRTAKTSSISLKDVQNVEGNVGPLFGSLIFTSKFFQNNTQSIYFLRRKDVIDIQQLLQGYMVAIHGGIDISSIATDKLLLLLNDLGGMKSKRT